MNIAVLGAGQLGRMLALSGIPLGLRFRFLDPSQEPCAAAVGEVLQGAYDDGETLRQLCADAAVVTYEFENVPIAAAAAAAARTTLSPPLAALQHAQDRGEEKALFDRLGIPVAPYALIDDEASLHAGLAAVGLPAVLKTRRLGYDGKGQRVLRSAADVAPAWAALGGQALILERFVAFEREISCLGVRGRDGVQRFYPVSTNVHRDGILRVSRPRADDPLQALAEGYTAQVMDALGYVGVMAFEFFVCGTTLLGNEIAPRVHNSGHWTQDGAVCSQFENHLRAITGLPLGPTALRQPCAMVNLIGAAPPRAALLASAPGLRLHLYDKQPQRGRKIGHVNLVADSDAALESALARVLPLIEETADG
jgi:5-(carboxyamino)imidazole ribonucleotide synthase